MSSAHEEYGGPDADLVAALVACDCQGPLWDEVADRLARYGLPTVLVLLQHPSRLADATATLGRPVRLSQVERDDLRRGAGVADRMATDAVVKGLQLFRSHAVLGGRWRPGGGASLQTYFVNGCLLALANIVRRWQGTRRGDEPSVPCDPEVLDLTQHGGATRDPLDVLVGHEDVDRILEWLGPVLAHAALLRLATGDSWAAVASEMGISAKTLERQLQRFRAKNDSRGPEAER